MMKALIFDCDGVLVDTEKDGHRVAFNRAFAEKGYDFQWDMELYGQLLKIAGGKERMRYYFDNHNWPADAEDKDAFIKEMHKLKTDMFMEIIKSGQLPLRSGVTRLIDEAIADGMTLAICTTSNERAVNMITEKLLGDERKSKFSCILAGDVVLKKKPYPEIYNLAKTKLGLTGDECVVVEDSRNGLLAAKGAGMNCIVTVSGYTGSEDFHEADAIYPELGDQTKVNVTLQNLKQMFA